MNESSGQLSNIKSLERPQKTTKVDDRRNLSWIKKNHFTTHRGFKDTVEEVGVPLSRSAIKRQLHEWNRGFTARWKPLVTLSNKDIRLEHKRKQRACPQK